MPTSLRPRNRCRIRRPFVTGRPEMNGKSQFKLRMLMTVLDRNVERMVRSLWAAHENFREVTVFFVVFEEHQLSIHMW